MAKIRRITEVIVFAIQKPVKTPLTYALVFEVLAVLGHLFRIKDIF